MCHVRTVHNAEYDLHGTFQKALTGDARYEIGNPTHKTQEQQSAKLEKGTCAKKRRYTLGS